MHQLLMRGADINYLNRKTGMTHLRHAIDEQLPVKIINFLIKSGANPHILDYKDQDCCEVAKDMHLYKKVQALQSDASINNPKLRIKPQAVLEKMENRRALIFEMSNKVEKKRKLNQL